MSKDVFHNTLSAIAYAPVAVASAGDKAGLVVDMQNYESGKLVLMAGVVTAGSLIIKEILEGDETDVSDGVAIPAARLFGTIAALDTSATKNELGFHHAKRYVKATFTADTNCDLLASAFIEKGIPHQAPTQT